MSWLVDVHVAVVGIADGDGISGAGDGATENVDARTDVADAARCERAHGRRDGVRHDVMRIMWDEAPRAIAVNAGVRDGAIARPTAAIAQNARRIACVACERITLECKRVGSRSFIQYCERVVLTSGLTKRMCNGFFGSRGCDETATFRV